MCHSGLGLAIRNYKGKRIHRGLHLGIGEEHEAAEVVAARVALGDTIFHGDLQVRVRVRVRMRVRVRVRVRRSTRPRRW